MRHRGDLAGQVQATQPRLGQRILSGKDTCFPQTPHSARAKVPDQSFMTSGIRPSRVPQKERRAGATYVSRVPESARPLPLPADIGR